jgi:hypothetical protein
MPLQFRRGHSDNLPNPSDASVGEPIFTTNDGKLRIKKANGQYVVINDGSNSSSNIDLSGIDSGLLVKVNSTQDGFVAASASDLPSHTHAIANVTGLQAELDAKADLDELPQNNDGTLNIAQESTLQSLVDRTITAGAGLTGGGDLSADRTLSVSFAGSGAATTAARSDHTHAATELTTTAISTGYLKWNYSAGQGSWAIESVTASAPDFIDGGDANADDPNGGN